MFYVYVLQSSSDKSLYVGYSAELRNRIVSHNEGKNASTRGKRPWRLIFYEAYLNRLDAKRRETYLKTTKGKTTLKSMLKIYLGY